MKCFWKQIVVYATCKKFECINFKSSKKCRTLTFLMSSLKKYFFSTCKTLSSPTPLNCSRDTWGMEACAVIKRAVTLFCHNKTTPRNGCGCMNQLLPSWHNPHSFTRRLKRNETTIKISENCKTLIPKLHPMNESRKRVDQFEVENAPMKFVTTPRLWKP